MIETLLGWIKKLKTNLMKKKLFAGPSIKNGRRHEYYLYLKSVSIELSEVISKMEGRIPWAIGNKTLLSSYQ